MKRLNAHLFQLPRLPSSFPFFFFSHFLSHLSLSLSFVGGCVGVWCIFAKKNLILCALAHLNLVFPFYFSFPAVTVRTLTNPFER